MKFLDYIVVRTCHLPRYKRHIIRYIFKNYLTWTDEQNWGNSKPDGGSPTCICECSHALLSL